MTPTWSSRTSPSAVTDVQAVIVDDMVATGFTGVENMEILVGEVVVVLGIGPVGLMAVAAAALRGAGRIIAVGSRPNTVALAKQYGATDIVDYKQGDVTEQIMTLTSGHPVDSVLVASGGSASEQISMALELVEVRRSRGVRLGLLRRRRRDHSLRRLELGHQRQVVHRTLAGQAATTSVSSRSSSTESSTPHLWSPTSFTGGKASTKAWT